MTKKCPKCGLEKSILEFYQRKKHRTGEYYEKCKLCMRERGKQYYHDNHHRQLALALKRKARYRDERRKFIDEQKINKPCTDCNGLFPPYVMDFDHKIGKIKIASISWLTFHNTSSLEKIKMEIAKCDLVCANCHRIRTHDRILKLKYAAIANVVKASA